MQNLPEEHFDLLCVCFRFSQLQELEEFMASLDFGSSRVSIHKSAIACLSLTKVLFRSNRKFIWGYSLLCEGLTRRISV